MKAGTIHLVSAAIIAAFTSFGADDVSRVFIEFQPGAKQPVKGALKAANAPVHFEFDDLNALVVTVPSEAVGALQHNPNIVLVEVDPLRQLCSEVIPYGVDRVQATDLWDDNDDGVL